MRNSFRRHLLLAFFILANGAGCTSLQLRRHTILQAATIHDIYQQQVLDNLAMFVHNRGACPYFALIGQGTSSLTDTASLAETNAWGRNFAEKFIYTGVGLNPSLMRSQQGTWQTYPINDSVKLTVMRCIYHAAVDGSLGSGEHSCPDCANLFYAYYNIQPPVGDFSIPYHGGPSNDPSDPSNTPAVSGLTQSNLASGSNTVVIDVPFGQPDQFKGYVFKLSSQFETFVEESYADATPLSKNTVLRLRDNANSLYARGSSYALAQFKRLPIRGIVTPECLNFPTSWFRCGLKLPKHFNKCLPHGYYCGTYIWVPEEGIDQLTKLTLLIQDVAYYDPPQAGTETVTTQKAAGTPGPSSQAKANLINTLSSDMHAAVRDNKPMTEDLKFKSLLLQSLLQQDAPNVTTTTTITPSQRQPTRFQPGILNLQQDLNLLPPQPH